MNTNTANLQKAITYAQTKWLREWLEGNLPEMMGLNDSPADIEKACAWREALEKIMVERGLNTPEKQKNRWTDVRNALKALDSNHPALSVVGLSAEEFHIINSKSRDTLHERATKFIDDPQAIVDKAVDLLDSREWPDVALAIAVLTGRRCSEILLSDFELNSEFSLTFSKPLKRGKEGVPLSFEIPTLAPAEPILKAIAFCRDRIGLEGVDPQKLSPRDINSRYEGPIKRAGERHFSGLVPAREGHQELYTHLFRAVYAVIAAHWYCPPSINELDFRAAIQGHFEILDDSNQSHRLNLMSQRNYWDYAIDNGESNIDGRLGIKLSQPGITVIKRFQKFLPEATASQKEAKTATPTAKAETTKQTQAEPTSDESQAITPQAASDIDLESTQSPEAIATPGKLDPPTPDTAMPTPTKNQSPKKRYWAKRPVNLFSDTRKRFEAIAKQWGLPEAETLDRLLDIAQRTEEAADNAPGARTTHQNIPDNATVQATPDNASGTMQTAKALTTETIATDAIAQLQETLGIAKALTEQLLDRDRLQQLSQELESVRAQLADTELRALQQREQIDQITRENQNLTSQLAAVRSHLKFLFDGGDSPQPKGGAAAALSDTAPDTSAKAPEDSPKSDPPKRQRVIDKATIARINRVIDQIIDFNNAPARAWEDKWAITLSTLKKHRILTCSQQAIARVLKQRKAEIDQHHHQHALGGYHNRRHKHSIKEAIAFDDPDSSDSDSSDDVAQ